MRSLSKITSILLITLALTSLSAFSEDTETRLLEQALVEGAVTKEQKTAINRYFINIASQKQKESDRLREMAELARGGKSATQDIKKRELIKKADLLEEEANSYKQLSVSVDFLPQTSIATR
jgi:5-enolpyruvylshikimate-3-phosphate synthase